MTTGILDEHHFNNQCSLYESTRTRSQTVPLHRQTTTTTLFETESTPSVNNNRRVKYSTQTSVPSSHITSNSIHKRHSSSTDILSLIRSFALKPFRTSSMTNGITAGQTNNVISDTNVHIKPPVSLLRFRPLSDNVTSHASYAQSTRSCEDFLKRMGWPVNSTTDEARVKWNTAMKFLFPSKFDVNRAISLYRRHEDVRKNENLDHIWFNNPHLTREIQSSKFFALPQLQNQPLTVCFTAANMINVASTNSLSEKDRELVTLQALICQLDVATESMDVQQNGLNFIYDMQNCSASQFDMNLTKKILKLLQGGYPAMLKNLFIISAPKWFRVGYKVTMYTPDQIRECLTTQYGYSLDDIPISFGGLFDPILEGDTRCEKCLLTVRNPQSICYPYYSPDCQPITTKSSRNILFLSADHQDRKKSNVSTSTTTNSQASLVAIVALRRHHDSSSQIRVRKRESSTSSSDSEKRRRRSNDSLIEEEPRVINSLTFIPTEISTE